VKLRRNLNPGFSLLLFVPAVDVAAAMLVFFLLSGGFLLQPGISVKPPDSPFLLAPQRDPRVVSITAEPLPAIYFDNQKLDARELDGRLASLREGARTIIIKADRRAPVDLLVQVTNVAVARGFSVVLATAEKP
jgi:biopolymer transport protein ExbD